MIRRYCGTDDTDFFWTKGNEGNEGRILLRFLRLLCGNRFLMGALMEDSESVKSSSRKTRQESVVEFLW
jgi:hypothetical protein